jgi:protein ImuB
VDDLAVRTLCLWCPDWPVAAARRRDPHLRDAPVAIFDRGVVLAASADARADGVMRGLRRREAEARCAGLAILDTDPAGDARAFECVARAVETLTPRVALDRPGLLSFPTRGPSRYFGGDVALGERVLAAVGAAGVVDVCAGIADGGFTARLAARRAGSRSPGAVEVVGPGESPAFLASWPVSVLDDTVSGDGLADLLARLGLFTLGDLAAVPASAVLARFGTAGLVAHRRARGLDEHPPNLSVPPPDLVEVIELDPPAERVDVAMFAGKSLADRLLAQLDLLGIACTRVAVEAETEHGERLTRLWRHEGALTAAALAERIRWQLEGWLTAGGGTPADTDLAAADTVTGGLTLLRLRPDDIVPAGGRQLGFWGADQAAADRAARALARVQGLLGHEHVVTAVVGGGRTPHEQVRLVPWGDPREPVGEGQPWPGAVPPPAPAVVLANPAPADLLDARDRPVTVSGRGDPSAPPARVRSTVLPRGGGPVVAWAGPWLHDIHWWDTVARCRRALWQVVLDDDTACLVTVTGGSALIEAVYD